MIGLLGAQYFDYVNSHRLTRGNISGEHSGHDQQRRNSRAGHP
jgi:hypothetical protein